MIQLATLPFSIDTLVQILALAFATLTFIVSQSIERKRDRKIAKRDNYQKLEFASNELFRFEADHQDLIRPIYEKETPVPSIGTAAYTATMNYVCQILNLFELAIKFRDDKTIEPEVFATWVGWFYQLSRAPGFPIVWKDVRSNYLPTLRSVMNDGIQTSQLSLTPVEKEKIFYDLVSEKFQCETIKNWLIKESEETTDDVKKLKSVDKNSTFKPASDISIKKIQNPEDIDSLVQFFLDNAGKKYISHGELQCGRAISTDAWSPDIASVLSTEFSELLSSDEKAGLLIGAYRDEKLAGLALIEFSNATQSPYATLSDIIVDHSLRHEGIGQKLIDKVVRILREKNIQTCYAESNMNNSQAHAFLEKSGFQKISSVFLMKMT